MKHDVTPREISFSPPPLSNPTQTVDLYEFRPPEEAAVVNCAVECYFNSEHVSEYMRPSRLYVNNVCAQLFCT